MTTGQPVDRKIIFSHHPTRPVVDQWLTSGFHWSNAWPLVIHWSLSGHSLVIHWSSSGIPGGQESIPIANLIVYRTTTSGLVWEISSWPGPPVADTLLRASAYPTPLRGRWAPRWGLSSENAQAFGFSLRYLTRPSKLPVCCPWDFQWSQPYHHESCRICPRERTLPQTHEDSASMLKRW